MMGDQISDHVSAPAHSHGDIHTGLRDYMRSVYNKMSTALVVSGVTAMITAAILGVALKGVLAIVFALLPLPFVFVISYGLHKFSYSTVHALFWAFAVAMGMSLSTLFVVFTTQSIATVFFISAATFAAASLWGYTTNTDLTKMGNFLFMGMVGIMIAMVVNIFLGSSMVMFVVSVLGVLIFTGLTAYDVQNLKNDYLNWGEVLGFDSPEKSALYGAFSLYLNFINIFQFLLNLLGDRD